MQNKRRIMVFMPTKYQKRKIILRVLRTAQDRHFLMFLKSMSLATG